MTVGIVAVILATFFHDRIASLFSFPPGVEMKIVYLGLLGGGLLGFCGIALTVLGLLRTPVAGATQNLLLSVAILAMVIILFFIFLYASFNRAEQPQIRPGETVTI